MIIQDGVTVSELQSLTNGSKVLTHDASLSNKQSPKNTGNGLVCEKRQCGAEIQRNG